MTKPESVAAVHTHTHTHGDNLIKAKKNFDKEKLITYLIILLFCTVACSPLLQMHIASDTYNLMDLGYFEYPSHYFLKDARIMSTLATYIAGILNLSYPTYIVGMEILAVIIASISMYILYQTIIEKTGLFDNYFKKTLLLISVSIIIFNCISLEYFLYAECSVMCLSVLLSIIGARTFTKKTKFKYLKTLPLILLATFCYQGSVNIFITLVILFLLIDKNKISGKEILKQFILAGTILAISFLINVLVMYFTNFLLNESQTRVGKSLIFENPLLFFICLIITSKILLITNYNLLPAGITIIFICITAILSFCANKSFKKAFKYILVVLVAISSCMAPIFLTSSPAIEPRMAMSVGSIIGISLIYLNLLDTSNKKILHNIIIFITIAFFIYNTIHVIQIFTAHIVTNKLDANMGVSIKYKIEQYEHETGNKIKKVAYYEDSKTKSFPYGYKHNFSSFTQRAFENKYCINEALNYYCGRKFEQVDSSDKIYQDNFLGKNWDTYAEEQIVFDKDTIHICIY